ncbi:bifunctional diaminohydroxyphosphoribosylaminopyrimidine deaminase/5-amino-6-(5-phosphoribosylamino)uracil reductase RibD [Sulfurospirillum sp. 1307]
MVENNFLQFALDKAWSYQGLTYPNPPVGSVITDEKNSLISYGVHKKAGTPHAEVNAIKNAYLKLTNDKKILDFKNSDEIHEYLYKNHDGIFKDKFIYVTLEPCNHYGKTPPCSRLISELGFKKVIVGTLDTNKKASGGIEFLKEKNIHVELINSLTCKELLEPFELWQKDKFVFFKLAMSNNGVIDGGTITCKASRELVHKLRHRCDLLVIGGNTVRIDRPTLDARMINGKAPDVLIYSKSKEFDKTIPLFNVENRVVHIEDNFEKLKNYKFIMIEGGEGMLEATKDLVSHYMIFHSPYFKKGKSPQVELNLKELFSDKIGKDRYTWYKKINA